MRPDENPNIRRQGQGDDAVHGRRPWHTLLCVRSREVGGSAAGVSSYSATRSIASRSAQARGADRNGTARPWSASSISSPLQPSASVPFQGVDLAFMADKGDRQSATANWANLLSYTSHGSDEATPQGPSEAGLAQPLFFGQSQCNA